MPARIRSPFGAVLREERRAQHISQAELAATIAFRFENDPSVAELGVISDRAIANIEAAKSSPNEFVRPRHETVQLLMSALGIDPVSERGQAMLQAAEATRRRDEVLDPQHVTSSHLPFVRGGREHQWMALVAAWERVRAGQPQMLMVAGTAGTGKTSLVNEFCQHALSDNPDVIIGYGECAIGASTSDPYLPYRQAISSIMQSGLADSEITDYDDLYGRLLVDSVRKLGGALIDTQVLKSYLAARAPQHLAELERIRESLAATDTEGRFDQAMLLVKQATTVEPVILVLEDLHWADESSCALLLYVQRQMRHHTDMPLMVIGTYRPSDLANSEDRHPLLQTLNELGRHMNSFVLDLDRAVGDLAGKSFVQELASSFVMAPKDRDDLVNMLFERTEGHPLFTAELIQHMVSNGTLKKRSDQTWAYQPNDHEADLPGKIRAIYQERIGRLPDAARNVIEAASVQGSTFIADVLTAVTDIPDEELDILIDRDLSERHHLVRAMAGTERANRYEFHHHAISEYVYQSISQRRKRKLHKLTAEALIEFYASTPHQSAALAAWHYEQAGMHKEAVEQAILASYAALVKLDYDLTLVWVDRSEKLAIIAENSQILWTARLRRAQALRGLGQLPEAHRVSQEALQHARQLSDDNLEAQALDILALISYDQGRLMDAASLFAQAIERYERLGRFDRVSANQSMLSHCNNRIGRIDVALEHARAALKSAPKPAADGYGAEAMLAIGNTFVEVGSYSTALEHFASAYHVYELIGETRGMLLAGMNTGYCMIQLGFAQKAVEQLDKIRREATQLRTPRLMAYACFYHGLALEASGDHDEALSAYRTSLNTRRKSGQESMIGDDLAGLLRIALHTKERVEPRLAAFQAWWRNHDPSALEDPLLALLTFAKAYEANGETALLHATLDEGVGLFATRAKLIVDEDMRSDYLSQHPSGNALVEMAEQAGLVVPNHP